MTLLPDHPLGRRAFLALTGAGLGALALGSCGEPPAGASPYTLRRWVAERPAKGYLVGHRGAGDVVPEHTIESYAAALGWGARALEVSVVRTKDGVLFCQHDLTLDRTTDRTGPASAVTWAELESARVTVPRLGPRWTGDGAPRLARLDAVLDRFGHRAVLCLEAKDDSAFPAMLEMVKQKGLADSVVIKLYARSKRFPAARDAGYPIFGYLGSFAECTPAAIARLAAKLNARTDYLVVPANENGTWLPEAALKEAVATGVPTWVFGVHRRSELSRHLSLGAVGAVVSSIGYVTGASTSVTQDGWGGGAIAPGEMTRLPESNGDGLVWRGGGVVAVGHPERQGFVTLGQLTPLHGAKEAATLRLDVRVDQSPAGQRSPFTVAFGHADDQYYENGQGLLDGYHALLTWDGALELWSHAAGRTVGTLLGRSASATPLVEGQWISLKLSVTASQLGWTRLDTGGGVSAQDSRYRGPYVHVGHAAGGVVSLRRLSVS